MSKSKPGYRWRMQVVRDGKFPAVFDTSLNPGAKFDELVVDDWLHVEQMDDRSWWVRLGDADFMVTIRSSGKCEVVVQSARLVPMGNGAVELRGEEA